jgi:predicted acylesterase/phospholipase RssA/proteasome lid subunit RPN8/RPN11
LVLRAAALGDAGREISDEVERIILDWAEGARVDWCNVMEDRPEIVVRRDQEAPTRWFAGKTVALWGCGALGGPVAEFLARAGVNKLVLRDHRVVMPGLLVRQVFEDQDIGRPKAHALADRLRRIRPDLEVVVDVADLVDGPLSADDWTDGADLIIDTTASAPVLAKLELVRWTMRVQPVPVASMAVGHRADRGFVIVSPVTHTGGPADVCRRAKLEVLSRPALRAYADEFWPQDRRPIFQPEPGCSEPTFVGAAADVASLAGIMLNAAAAELESDASSPASANFFTLPTASIHGAPNAVRLRWEADRVSDDPHSGYQIRIAEPAWREIVAWVERSRRVAGPTVETGGLLFGERDEALRITWVSEASGPPPDSQASKDGFVCGVTGVPELNGEKRSRSLNSVMVIGMWHSHPGSAPLPSPMDARGMAAILDASSSPSARSLLFIIGHATSGIPVFGTFEFSRSDVERMKAGALERVCAMRVAPPRPVSRRVGLALSGGGARAMAFHLGCLRALRDRGILEQVEVVSCVSGGSIIGAMYAYGDGPFEEFDRRVVELLRQGLTPRIARRLFSPRLLPAIVGTLLTAGIAAKGADAACFALSLGGKMLGLDARRVDETLRRVQPPLRRWASRTTAFEAALRQNLFGDRNLSSARRGGLDVVINACELRTGSAFRFGSRQSGCWRVGQVRGNDVPVALAVAASAAYPVLLPALDREFVFVDQNGKEQRARVLLTDGGIFDNLGVTCMEPGRSEAVSYNVYAPGYIIACDAGAGLLADDPIPYWWPSRMVRSFESVFRKVQNGAYQRLHSHVAAGLLRGFVLSYLGQRDDQLPHRPPDLVPRSDVANYPTDLAPMRDDDIQRLAARGEVLTRLLLNEYCPEL